MPVERLLVACALLTAAGTGLRGARAPASLFAGALAPASAIAIAQALLPVFIRSRYPDDVGVLTGAFSMSLPLGAALGSAFAVPLANALGGWEPSLAVWALPAWSPRVVWFPRARNAGRARTHPGAARPARSARVVDGTVLRGAVGGFYAGLSWLPSILEDDGYSRGVPGTLQAVSELVQIAPAFLLPVIAGRRRAQTGLVVGVAAVQVAGCPGLLAAPDAALLWMAVLGVGQGAVLGLGLILPVLRGGDAGRSRRSPR